MPIDASGPNFSHKLYPLQSFTVIHECPECGLFNGMPQVLPGIDICCLRCGKVLRRVRHNSLDITFACALAGLFLTIIAIGVMLLNATAFGRFNISTLISGPIQLDNQGFWMVASIVLMTTAIIPLIKLGGILTVLVSLRKTQPSRWTAVFFGWLKHIGPWAMIEIYLLALLVAYTRLKVMMHVTLGEAVYALAGMMIALIAVDAMLDHEAVWEKLKNALPLAKDPIPEGLLIGCDTCHQVNRAYPTDECERCGSVLFERKPNSLRRTWALMVAAAICYIPSNILPVMTITQYGRSQSYTILGGIHELSRAGLLAVAVLVFVVSIIIPLFKLVSLGYLLAKIHYRSSGHLRGRTRLYRLIEFIGRWSMLDVFVVSILVALVRFGQGNQITAAPGIVFFAAVVTLTLFAVECFDPRLMWDVANTSSPKARDHD